MKWLVTLALSAAALAPRVDAQEHIAHGKFEDVALYRPAGETAGFVLLLSGHAGWDADAARRAQALVERGAMVAGIDTPKLLAKLETDGDVCTFPGGDMENLSHYLQGYAKLPTYHTPVLLGFDDGAALAVAVLAQSPSGTFSGLITQGFCPSLPLTKPLCKGEDARATPHADGHGVDLLPTTIDRATWTAVTSGGACDAAAAQFVAAVPGSRVLPAADAEAQAAAVLDTFADLQSRHAALPPPPASLDDLPLVEVPAEGDGELFAILVSGDGGWAGLDKDVAAALSRKGIPVAGIDSLRYFWSARTPEGFAADIDRVLRYYASQWKKSKVLLIGYSQGADVMPFALNRLPAASKARVAQTVLIGLGTHASFEFHLSNWVGGADDGLPILPEASLLDAVDTLCLYGADEGDSLCPTVPAGHVTAEALPGGHHLNGDYDALADRILSRVQAR